MVTLDFLVPATVLGMVGPVVAKMAVEQARKAGSAIGDVYFWGAIGSIAGTFLCGFVLMYLAPTSTIVLLVAAALALLAAALIGEAAGLAAGLWRRSAWVWARSHPLVSRLELGGVDLGSYQMNYLALAGNAAALRAGDRRADRAGSRPPRPTTRSRPPPASPTPASPAPTSPGPSLADLAMLAFVASLAFMALEMVAGRLVQRHLGSSIYGWTSVIGVLLGRLVLRQLPGGKDRRLRQEREAGELALPGGLDPHLDASSAWRPSPSGSPTTFLGGDGKSFLSQAITLSKLDARLRHAFR